MRRGLRRAHSRRRGRGRRTELAQGWPKKFEELTEGRPAGVFHYLADGVGLLSVYHVENADPDSETFIDDWYTENFGLWLVDLEAWSAEPLEAWELGSANVFFSRVGERFFVHRVAGDFSETKIYEVTPDGAVREHITIPGYAAYPILRVR